VAFHWEDPNGSIVTLSPELVYFDEDGYYWGIDFQTGQALVQASTTRYYAASLCTGSAWAPVLIPRMPTRFGHDGLWRVRPDTLASSEVCRLSYKVDNGPGVEISSSCTHLIPLDQLLSLGPGYDPPELPWTGPLHPVEGAP
jgi:hypothetical protein